MLLLSSSGLAGDALIAGDALATELRWAIEAADRRTLRRVLRRASDAGRAEIDRGRIAMHDRLRVQGRADHVHGGLMALRVLVRAEPRGTRIDRRRIAV